MNNGMLKLDPFNIAFLEECISQRTEDPVFALGGKGLYLTVYPLSRPNRDTINSTPRRSPLKGVFTNVAEHAIDSDSSLCVGRVCVPRAASDMDKSFRLVLSW